MATVPGRYIGSISIAQRDLLEISSRNSQLYHQQLLQSSMYTKSEEEYTERANCIH